MVGNGRSVHALDRSAAVARRGHDVRLVTLGPVLPVEGIEVRTRPIPRGLRAAAAAARSFLDDIASFRPDLLHLHYAGGKLGTMATLSRARPLVVTVMGGDVLPEQHPGGFSVLERRATRRILEEAAVILVKSDALRPAVEAFGDFGDRVRTVRWGVDPAVFHRDEDAARALAQRLGLRPTDRVVLSPRILQPLYNVHRIVEAMPRVVSAVPEAVLVVTEYQADEGYRQRVLETARAAGVADRVRLAGRVEHADMPALYSRAEVAVSVPSSDGLPQSLFEAMACETPVVLGALPAYGEMVRDAETAILVEVTPAAIAEALVGLLQDDGRRRALAARALAVVRERARLPAEVERVEGFYVEALATRRPRPRHLARAADALGLLVR